MSVNIVSHAAGNSDGCTWWRFLMPHLMLRMCKSYSIFECTKVIPIPEWYKDIRIIRVQRQVSDQQHDYLTKFLRPVANRYGIWLYYDIDDVIYYEDIPAYNANRKPYEAQSLKGNIANMCNAVDMMTTTTPELAENFVKRFGVDRRKIKVIPNYVPNWWMPWQSALDGLEQRVNTIFTPNRKIRVGFTCSMSHFDIANQNGGKDDFIHLKEFILSSYNKYQFVFIGGYPSYVQELIKIGKIEHIPGKNIFDFPQSIKQANMDVIVAPLMDNEFNRCKSNIKIIEGTCFGIPVICQDLDCYNKDTGLLFTDGNQLQNKIDFLFSSKENYINEVRQKHSALVGDSTNPDGWTLEKNLHKWESIFKVAPKTVEIDMTKILVNKMEIV